MHHVSSYSKHVGATTLHHTCGGSSYVAPMCRACTCTRQSRQPSHTTASIPPKFSSAAVDARAIAKKKNTNKLLVPATARTSTTAQVQGDVVQMLLYKEGQPCAPLAQRGKKLCDMIWSSREGSATAGALHERCGEASGRGMAGGSTRADTQTRDAGDSCSLPLTCANKNLFPVSMTREQWCEASS